MQKRTPPFTSSALREAADLPASALSGQVSAYLFHCEIQSHSPATLASRKERLGRLEWFVQTRELSVVDLTALRRFFQYLLHGHEAPGGRWGNPVNVKPLSSGRIKTYHATLRAFFNWLVIEGEIAISPMERIPTPVDRPDQIEPFTDDEVRRMLAASRQTAQPRRDEAILTLLYDTGLRLSEIASLTVGDLDLQGLQLTVRRGKGGKSRTVCFSPDTRRVVYNLLREREVEDSNEPLFVSARGCNAADRLTEWGFKLLVRRIGNAAGVAKAHPHRWRHTFAVAYLRAGGSEFSLQTILGHTSLAMTRRYVMLCQADLSNQHRRFSPVANLKRRS